MNADKGSPDALLVEPRTTPAQDRPRRDVSPVRPPRRDASTIVGVLAAVVVAALVALGVWAFSRPATTPETLAPAQTAHDSGITQALRERDQALEVHHDSGIAQALRERDQAGRSPTAP